MMSGMRRSFVFVALCTVLCACSSRQQIPVPPVEQPPLAESEFAEWMTRIGQLDAEGREPEALAAVADALKLRPDDAMRRELARVAWDLRRQVFYAEHPLRFELALDRPDYVIGDVARVKLSLFNLGARELTLRARYRTWGEALRMQAGERASLDLVIDEVDSDGLGSLQKRRRALPVAIEDDVEIGSGGVAVIAAEFPVEPAPGALYRTFTVGARLQPLALEDDEGELRFDRLEPSPARAIAVAAGRTQPQPEGEAALDALSLLLAADAVPEPDALFLTAVRLGPGQLKAGIDLLARAAPALDARRRPAALAALEMLTGEVAGGDALRFLNWWDTRGRGLSDEQLVARAEAARAADRHLDAASASIERARPTGR